MSKLFAGKFEVIALTRSWHGVTAGASAHTYAGGRRGYGPATPGAFAIPAPYEYRCPIRHCDGNCDCTCLEAGFELFDQASVGLPAAVLAEPVLSAGGVIVPPPGYFTRMAELCDERGMQLVLDECQTGLGRLGSLYGFEVYDVVPDFLVAVEDARRRHSGVGGRDDARDRGALLRARLHPRDLARLGPAAGGGRRGGARRGDERGPAGRGAGSAATA